MFPKEINHPALKCSIVVINHHLTSLSLSVSLAHPSQDLKVRVKRVSLHICSKQTTQQPWQKNKGTETGLIMKGENLIELSVKRLLWKAVKPDGYDSWKHKQGSVHVADLLSQTMRKKIHFLSHWIIYSFGTWNVTFGVLFRFHFSSSQDEWAKENGWHKIK